MAILETRGLSKRYGDLWALRDVDLAVERGEVFGFLGPNGAGKTTFTKCVTGFIKATSGGVHILGKDALEDPARTSFHVGLVPDQYDFYPNLTGRQHLDFYGRLYGLPNEARSARIETVLEQMRMQERADTRVKTYSHGMKQRICIAQAILHEPELVFFDEPTNGLDPKGAYELRQMIRDLAKDGTTVFLNSHILHEVEQVCDRVAILDRGTVRMTSRVDDLRHLAEGGAAAIRVANPTKRVQAAVTKVAGTAPELDGHTLRFSTTEDALPSVVAAVVQAGGKVQSVQPPEASLESVFLQVTEAD